MDPDFQRGHVWKKYQKKAFIEWGLKGGESGMSLYFNHPEWMNSFEGQMLLIDGKQRLNCVLEFLDNKIKVFDGLSFSDFKERIPSGIEFAVNVLRIKSRFQILEWYSSMNSGGAAHTEKEINRVKALIDAERKEKHLNI
jgi:hypothetical protein